MWLVRCALLAGLSVAIAAGCGQHDSPSGADGEGPGQTGEIRFEVTYAPWTPAAGRPAGADTLDKATAWVYDAAHSMVAQQDLEIDAGRATGSLTVQAQDDLRVVLGLFGGETVRFLGADTVDVPAGGSVVAHITEVYLGTAVTGPDWVATGETYRVWWAPRPFAQWYEVQESVALDFAGAGWVHSGPDTTATIAGKAELDAGWTYYYRARVVTEYGAGPWHGQASVQVAAADGTIHIDVPLPGAPVPPGSESISLAAGGAQRWAAGSTQTIRWNSTGVQRVDIEYSLDNGVTWAPLATDVDAAVGIYSWDLPETETAACIVRLVDAANPHLSAQTERPIAIVADLPFVTVTHPDGRERLVGGTECVVTWAHRGVDDVLISFSPDGGLSWQTIAEAVPAAAAAYSWRAPILGSNRCLVRICDGTDDQISDDSDAFFTVHYRPAIEMVPIPAGSFLMGSSNTQGGNDDEHPRHAVALTAFSMSATEITQEQWVAVMGYNPAKFRDYLNLPVESVRWFDALAFCDRLSELDGLTPCYGDGSYADFAANGYRLPTEAEWEYACRAGTTTVYYWGDMSDPNSEFRAENYEWCCYETATHQVGQKRPNPWGLYDMAGNVQEWCQDFYGSYRTNQDLVHDPTGPGGWSPSVVVRGNYYFPSVNNSRCAYRSSRLKVQDDQILGFRVVRR